MAVSECKGGKEITDFCHRRVSFAYTRDRKDLIVDDQFKIRDVNGKRNRLVIICTTCKKPPISSSHYIQFCGCCEWYYRGDPESPCCPDCEDVF